MAEREWQTRWRWPPDSSCDQAKGEAVALIPRGWRRSPVAAFKALGALGNPWMMRFRPTLIADADRLKGVDRLLGKSMPQWAARHGQHIWASGRRIKSSPFRLIAPLAVQPMGQPHQ